MITEFGKPFTRNGFGNWFRKRCDEAGLNHCSAHGLRKAASARMAELGCTELEIMAVTGHRTTKEIVRYTRGARQKVLAANAMAKLSAGQVENKNAPLLEADFGSGTGAPANNLESNEK
nr:tyrosine-type recombinase/integrase [Pelagibacterium lacus]